MKMPTTGAVKSMPRLCFQIADYASDNVEQLLQLQASTTSLPGLRRLETLIVRFQSSSHATSMITRGRERKTAFASLDMRARAIV